MSAEPTSVPASRLDTAVLGVLGVAVLAMPAAASFISLRAWAADNLALTGWTTVIAPLSLDLVMAMFIVSSVHATRRGQSAGGSRLMVALTMTASAVANFHHGATIGTPAALYYAAMPIVAALGLETIIRRVRHGALARLGVIEGPLPRFRPIRWAVDRRGTWAAWTYGVREGVSDPRQAIERSRRRPELVAAGVDDPAEIAERARELQAMSKTAALRMAFRELGEPSAPKAITFLARHGVEVSANLAHQVARKVRTERPELVAVDGGAS